MSLEREEMFTTAPPPAVSIIFGTASRVSRNALVTLKRSAVSKKRSLVSSAGRGPRAAGVVHEQVDAGELRERRRRPAPRAPRSA